MPRGCDGRPVHAIIQQQGAPARQLSGHARVPGAGQAWVYVSVFTLRKQRMAGNSSARNSGVSPLSVSMRGSAPATTSAITADRLPHRAARCSGVYPQRSWDEQGCTGWLGHAPATGGLCLRHHWRLAPSIHAHTHLQVHIRTLGGCDADDHVHVVPLRRPVQHAEAVAVQVHVVGRGASTQENCRRAVLVEESRPQARCPALLIPSSR